jgi:hypothetical protein
MPAMLLNLPTAHWAQVPAVLAPQGVCSVPAVQCIETELQALHTVWPSVS